MEWGRSQTSFIQNIEIVWGAIIPPPGHVCPRPSANLPLSSIQQCSVTDLLTDHFWDRGEVFYESYEKHLLKNYFQPPPA